MSSHVHPLRELADQASRSVSLADFETARPLFEALVEGLSRAGLPVSSTIRLGQACALAATGALRASTDAVRLIPREARHELLADARTDRAVSEILAIGWDAHQMQGLLCAFAMRQGRWAYRTGFDAALDAICRQRAGVPLHRSLVFDAFAFGMPDHRIAAMTQRFFEDHRPAATHGRPPLRPAGGPVRVAMLSGEFRRHPTCFLHRDLVAAIDRREVHLTGVYLAEPVDRYTEAMRQACDAWLHWPGQTADEVARRLRAASFDVLWVMGSFQQTRIAEVLAHQPVPLVINGLASYYPHGPGLVDYTVVDPVTVPPGLREAWPEALIELPASPYVLGPIARLTRETPSRSALGLPDEAVVLAAMHQGSKMTPESADLWAAVLRRCPHAVLWRLALAPPQEQQWRHALAERGVDPDRREVVAPLTSWSEHLARIGAADLFLDATPVTGHTTLLEALSRGVPAVSLAGPGPAGRIGHSLLQAVGLHDACVHRAEDYIEQVTAWVNEPARRTRWAAALAEHGPSGARPGVTFDPARQARWWEALLSQAVSLRRAGQAPRSFSLT